MCTRAQGDELVGLKASGRASGKGTSNHAYKGRALYPVQAGPWDKVQRPKEHGDGEAVHSCTVYSSSKTQFKYRLLGKPSPAPQTDLSASSAAA